MKAVIENYRADVEATFVNYKKLAERALEQVSDQEFFQQSDEESNSIAVIVKHIAGNQRSRFTEFLTTDGEKPDRNRDSEFEMEVQDREELMKAWKNGWQTVFDSLGSLTVADFGKTVEIRGEKHTIAEALNRQLTHYAYHIGQIVFLAKHFRSAQWKTLSVARNRSAEFNKFLRDRGSGAKSHPLEGPLEFEEKIGKREEI